MTEATRTQFQTRSIKTYGGVAYFGVFVQRLGRDVPVSRDQWRDAVTVDDSAVTDDERMGCLAAVEAYLAARGINGAR